MIISHLQAGLGNQMFQYAAGLALAEHRRTILKLDPSWFRHDPLQESHNKYSLACFNIIEQFATEEEVRRIRGGPMSRPERWLNAGAKLLRLHAISDHYTRRGTSHVWFEKPFSPQFFELPDNTFLRGLWQSEKYFKPASEMLRLHFSFRYPPSPLASGIAARIGECKTPVSVHFRRGDYVKTARLFEEIKKLPPAEAEARKARWLEKIGCAMPLPLDYYLNAIKYLEARKEDLTLFIFSDDIDSVEQEFRPACKHFFVKGPLSPHDTMRVMSQCAHSITANSSFSWWAAWLNASPEKIVIAPAPWHATDAQLDADMVPADWVRLPAGAAA